MRPLLWVLGLLFPIVALAAKGDMTEIRYEDMEPGERPYLSRILVHGDWLRLDYGHDTGEYILFNPVSRHLYQVSPEVRRILEIPVLEVRDVWPGDWQLVVEEGGSKANRTLRVSLHGQTCIESRSADLLPREVAMLAAFRQALAGNQARTWQATPDDVRDPCVLAVEVREAGIEYRQGLPLMIRYGDGRQRRYLGHGTLPLRPELFQLPGEYERIVLP